MVRPGPDTGSPWKEGYGFSKEAGKDREQKLQKGISDPQAPDYLARPEQKRTWRPPTLETSVTESQSDQAKFAEIQARKAQAETTIAELGSETDNMQLQLMQRRMEESFQAGDIDRERRFLEAIIAFGDRLRAIEPQLKAERAWEEVAGKVLTVEGVQELGDFEVTPELLVILEGELDDEREQIVAKAAESDDPRAMIKSAVNIALLRALETEPEARAAGSLIARRTEAGEFDEDRDVVSIEKRVTRVEKASDVKKEFGFDSLPAAITEGRGAIETVYGYAEIGSELEELGEQLDSDVLKQMSVRLTDNLRKGAFVPFYRDLSLARRYLLAEETASRVLSREVVADRPVLNDAIVQLRKQFEFILADEKRWTDPMNTLMVESNFLGVIQALENEDVKRTKDEGNDPTQEFQTTAGYIDQAMQQYNKTGVLANPEFLANFDQAQLQESIDDLIDQLQEVGNDITNERQNDGGDDMYLAELMAVEDYLKRQKDWLSQEMRNRDTATDAAANAS